MMTLRGSMTARSSTEMEMKHRPLQRLYASAGSFAASHGKICSRYAWSTRDESPDANAARVNVYVFIQSAVEMPATMNMADQAPAEAPATRAILRLPVGSARTQRDLRGGRERKRRGGRRVAYEEQAASRAPSGRR